jgi:predicted SnoaL-like aldol condensation-catalyzing enzyme
MVDGRLTDIGQPAAWVVLGIFRLDNGRLAEHWDVIEDEATRATSISRLPMFDATFPS